MPTSHDRAAFEEAQSTPERAEPERAHVRRMSPEEEDELAGAGTAMFRSVADDAEDDGRGEGYISHPDADAEYGGDYVIEVPPHPRFSDPSPLSVCPWLTGCAASDASPSLGDRQSVSAPQHPEQRARPLLL